MDPAAFDFRTSPAFRRMEQIACRLVLDNQDLNLVAHTKVFREKAQSALREQQTEILRGFGVREISGANEVNKYDLQVQLDRSREALARENARGDALKQRLEESTQEFMDREIELNTLILRQKGVLESSRLLGPDDKGMAQMSQLYQDICEHVDALKSGLGQRLVSQERHIIDTYVGQIKALKDRFQAEFEENNRKWGEKGPGVLRKGSQDAPGNQLDPTTGAANGRAEQETGRELSRPAVGTVRAERGAKEPAEVGSPGSTSPTDSRCCTCRTRSTNCAKRD